MVAQWLCRWAKNRPRPRGILTLLWPAKSNGPQRELSQPSDRRQSLSMGNKNPHHAHYCLHRPSLDTAIRDRSSWQKERSGNKLWLLVSTANDQGRAEVSSQWNGLSTHGLGFCRADKIMCSEHAFPRHKAEKGKHVKRSVGGSYAILCDTMQYYVMLCSAMPCPALPCPTPPCHFLLPEIR